MPSPSIHLHGFWRSSSSHRTRIALNLKGVAYTTAAVDLRSGAQRQPAYLALQPQGLVPALEAEGETLFQSPAILEWVEARFPDPPLLPAEPGPRALVRAMCALVGCDVHPLNNLRTLNRLRSQFAADEDQVRLWAAHWIEEGFAALETLVERHGDGFAFGSNPTLADCYLVPQAHSALRFQVDLGAYPRIAAAVAAANALPAFIQAAPERQPDAPEPARLPGG